VSQHNVVDLNWRPSHAYIPGQTPRHDEGIFDQFKPNLSASDKELDHCIAWQIGQVFFQEEYYWEAHEVWEAVWMLCEEISIRRALVRSLIQLTNAGLKGKMGREKAQVRLLGLARLACPNFSFKKIMGFNPDDWEEFYSKASLAIPSSKI